MTRQHVVDLGDLSVPAAHDPEKLATVARSYATRQHVERLVSETRLSGAGLPDVLPYTREEAIGVLDASDHLETLTSKALSKMDEILSPPVDWSEPKMVSAQIAAATTILNTQVRVDEGRLKRRKLDMLPKLLEAMAKEKGRLQEVGS